MINVIPTHKTNFRTFGWVQDPSNLRSLCNVVAIFDNNSIIHSNLKRLIIPFIVEERDGRDTLLTALSAFPLRISYSNLVGTSFNPRSASRCNGIVQATVKGQGRKFIGDWPADNFVRWAHAFGFIKYNYSDDTFEITNSGLNLTQVRGTNNEISASEKEILINAILAYPPAIRILNLLADGENTHLTKFEIGKNLGFIGEDGFTSLPQNLLIPALVKAENAKERNSMKADWEGSSDKYARMIATWLTKLGLVSQISKSITVRVAHEEYTESIGQAYILTAFGLTSLNRSQGKSRHKRIPKNICFEMLATKGDDREYLRTRRAYILKVISETKKAISVNQIIDYLAAVNLVEKTETIIDDIRGLINIGLNIILTNSGYKFNDEINDFIIPLPQELTKSSLSDIKDCIRPQMTHISHEYLSLVDLAYDSKQNRLFEMKTLELLTEECNFEGLHLGGSRKPDGLIFTTQLSDNYGIIIDTKAYSGGYNFPIAQADEMERYVRENQTRDKKVNPNEWWNNFDNELTDYYFLFVSGHFIGNFKSQLDRISRNTNVFGSAIAVTNLLLFANAIKNGSLNHVMIKESMFKNAEYTF